MNTMNEMLFKIISHTCLNHFLSWITFDSLGHSIGLNTFQTCNFVFIWFKVNVSLGAVNKLIRFMSIPLKQKYDH